MILAWVRTAPRGTTSTAAVEIAANGSAGDTSAAALSGVPFSESKGLNPPSPAGPN